MSERFSREELERGFAHYCRINDEASASRDWSRWADKFTEDVHYVEHAYGEIHGREAVRKWIVEVMAPFPQMDFPIDWTIFDVERGWVMFQCQNRLLHPTDPSAEPFQFATWTLLKYAGDLLFRYEEDNYNPREATEAILAWREAGGRMLTREQVSMK